MALETLKFFSSQNDFQAFGSSMHDGREFTGKCSEDVTRGVVTVKKTKGNSE
jgi:hypothetical protein